VSVPRNRVPGPLATIVILAAACSDEHVPAARLGERLFNDPGLSTSGFNAVSCAICHVVDPASPAVVPGRFDPGFNLANTAGRPSWWGGYELTLLDALNVCLDRFMSGRLLSQQDEEARLLYAYLDANSPEPASSPLPFTVVRNVTGLADVAGDSDRGRDLYERACHRCHGAAHTGAGALDTRPPIVPKSTVAEFRPEQVRAVVEEKIRHGRFFNLAGVMPLYSVEVMTDADVADILAYLGL